MRDFRSRHYGERQMGKEKEKKRKKKKGAGEISKEDQKIATVT